MNPLLDKDFLRELDLIKIKETFVRIISLTFDEQPRETIEGKATSGSINIDGNSVIRRSCSFSLITEQADINSYYWGLKSKIKIEIGIKNTINSNYPEIIWFNQGIYILTSFNMTINTNSTNISLSGKDKGCLLNGDVAGLLTAQTDFGKEENITYTYSFKNNVKIENYQSMKYYKKTLVQASENDYKTYFILESSGYYVPATAYNSSSNYYSFILDTGVYNANTEYYIKNTEREFKYIKIKDIIQEAVHTFANEPYHNIEINDLENYGLDLIQYSGDSTAYLIKNANDDNIQGLILNGNTICYLEDEETGFAISNFNSNSNLYIPYFYNNLIQNNPTKFYFKNGNNTIGPFVAAVYNYGDAVGYQLTDLIYSGELIANIGESISSVLDKIKNLLGNFEYFYDVNGKFIFQQKKTYLDISWNPITRDSGEIFVDTNANSSAITYSFEGNYLINSIQNSPNLNNVKNDYSVWGIRKSLSGEEIPIHLRYAFQNKPTEYVSYSGIHYTVEGITYEQSIQNARNEIEEQTQGYTRIKPNSYYSVNNHQTLSDDWWEISEWAEYYKSIFETYPEGVIGNYANEGNIDSFSIKLGNYFDIASSGQYSRYTADQSFPLYIFDIDYTDDNEKPYTIGYTSHGKYCSHSYSYFLQRAREGKGTSFIYNPKLPAEDIEEYVEHRIEEYTSTHVNMKSGLDWREVLYQMAIDYYKNNQKEDFIPTLINNNKDIFGNSKYPFGKTGYEQYYADIEGFWRQLYDPEPEEKIIYSYSGGDYSKQKHYLTYAKTKDTSRVAEKQYYFCEAYVAGSGNELFEMGEEENSFRLSSDIYSATNGKNYFQIVPANNSIIIDYLLEGKLYEIINYSHNAPKISDVNCDYYISSDKKSQISLPLNSWEEGVEAKYNKFFSNANCHGWSRALLDDPQSINFWIDFINSGELEHFSVEAIGDRQKVINEKNVKAIYYKEVPTIIYYKSNQTESIQDRKDGYSYYQLSSNFTNLFSISSQGVSAKDKLDELLYQYSYCTETINITTIPIYYLQPNTRIFVHDNDTKIDGDYIINKLTIPMTYNGTMSINASKAPDRLY